VRGLEVEVLSNEQDWPLTGEKTLEVEAVSPDEKLTKFTAWVRRMQIEGSVFQDNSTLRNHKWIFSVHLKDETAIATPESSPLVQPTEHAVIVEMEELTLEADGTLDWHETARFRKGLEEDVRMDADGHEDFDKAHLGTISVRSLLDVMEFLKRGVSIFDTPAKSVQELCDQLEDELIDQNVVTEQQAKEVVNTMQLHHHHAIQRKEENLKRAGRDEALHRCGCDVLVGAVNFLKHPIAVFIRLDKPRSLGEMTTEGHFPTKFIFLCLGPHGHEKDEYHEVGRAFACLMSNRGFLNIVSEAPSKLVVCEAVHTFLAQSDIIPQFHHVRYGTGMRSPGMEGDDSDSDSDSDSDEKQTVGVTLAKRGTSEQLMLLQPHDDAFSPRNARRASQDSTVSRDGRTSPINRTESPDPLLNPLQPKSDAISDEYDEVAKQV
jgi:mannitol/fructose-specific phosphotransferase system IIA component (Ntr-type)